MPSFGERSRRRLENAHPHLQTLCREAIRFLDFTVLETHRSPERQEELVSLGRSKTKKSLHLSLPSKAIDLAPWPLNEKDWREPARFIGLALYIQATCDQMQRDGRLPATFKLVWGGDWDSDGLYGPAHKDQTFDDLPHLQLNFYAERG